ncbi:MAG: hypothetical protein ABJC28_06665, partial [Acidobacteriota bacterium]
MTLRKSTKRWLAAFAIAIVLLVIDGGDADRLGVLGVLAWILATAAGWILAFRVVAAAFRLIVRRLSLRLAFSYFLIGIVPIPLLACLLLLVGYLLSFQFVGGRLRREMQAVAESASAGKPGAVPVEVHDGRVSSSGLDWLPAGTAVPWASKPVQPKLLLVDDRPWLAAGEVKDGGGRIFLLSLRDSEILQELADRTGYVVQAETGTAGRNRRRTGMQIDMEGPKKRKRSPPAMGSDNAVRPRARPREPEGSVLDHETMLGIYL